MKNRIALVIAGAALAGSLHAQETASQPQGAAHPNEVGSFPSAGGLSQTSTRYGVGRYGARLQSVVSRGAGQSAGTVISFEEKSQTAIDEMAEDLTVLTHIVHRNLERTLGDKATEYRLGVPILLDSGLVRAQYLDGFGVLVNVNVPFPVASVGEPEKKSDAPPPASEWERTKALLYGRGETDASVPAAAEPLRYDERLVASLKKQMIEAMRNGQNIRHLKSDEWIAVTIHGGANTGARTGAGITGVGGAGMFGAPGMGMMSGSVAENVDALRNTILTMRVKKSAAAANIERDTLVNAYFGAMAPAPTGAMGGYGGGYGSYPAPSSRP